MVWGRDPAGNAVSGTVELCTSTSAADPFYKSWNVTFLINGSVEPARLEAVPELHSLQAASARLHLSVLDF